MQKEHNISYFFITLAAVVIVLAGVKAASQIIVPFLLSLFLAVIFAPMYSWLNSRKIPQTLSLLTIVLFLIGLVTMAVWMVGSSVQDFSDKLPLYEEILRAKMASVETLMASWGVVLPGGELQNLFDPAMLMKYAAGTLQGFGSALTNGFVILFTVVFIMLEATQFERKIALFDSSNEGMRRIHAISDKIKHYMGLKAVMSLATGAVVTIMLQLFGLDYAILWGVVAFMFNFIPNIGSIIAAVPAVLLALIQLDPLSAGIIALGYVAINTVIGSVIEPKVMGKGLGLSTLVIFLSLIFWGWLLGPVGMLLSVPLTIMAKIALESMPNTRWIAILLGSGETEKLAGPAGDRVAAADD